MNGLLPLRPLLGAEARKFVTTRSLLGLAAAAALYPGLTLVGLAVAPTTDAPNLSGEGWAQILRGGADLLPLTALVLGILAVAGEFRHGTVVPSLLASPRRLRFMAAKLSAQAAVGVALAAVVSTVALGAGAIYLAATGVSVSFALGDVAVAVAGVVVVAAAFAAVGAAAGALVPNPTAAIAGALLWILVAENVIPVLFRSPGVIRWLPGGAADRLLRLVDPAPGAANPWLALAVLLATTAAMTAAAVVTFQRTDIN